jgi:hypothetical protein
MSNPEKSALINRLYGELLAIGMGHGDPHPQVQVTIVDTDPEPMSGPYVQVTASYRALLKDAAVVVPA